MKLPEPGRSDHGSGLRSPSPRWYDFGESSLKTLVARRRSRRVYGRFSEVIGRDEASKIRRVHSDERRRERSDECLAAAKDLHLALLGRGPRMKPHFAAAEEHDSRDARVRRHEKHAAGIEGDVEILDADCQVQRIELPGLIERDPE